MKIRGRKGTTLVEILIATFVFTVALAALLSSISGTLYLLDLSKDTTIANSDLRNIMELIRTTSFANMIQLFPDGVVDGPVSNSYQLAIGGYRLGNEHITVTYANPNSEPLEIQVNLTWIDKRTRSHSIAAHTFKTR